MFIISGINLSLRLGDTSSSATGPIGDVWSLGSVTVSLSEVLGKFLIIETDGKVGNQLINQMLHESAGI